MKLIILSIEHRTSNHDYKVVRFVQHLAFIILTDCLFKKAKLNFQTWNIPPSETKNKY